MGTTYTVVIDLSTKGNLAPAVDKAKDKLVGADQAAGTFMRSLQSMGSRVMRPLDMVASKAYELGSAFTKIGAGAGLAATVYGVSKLNNEMEKATISMGAMFAANNQARGFNDGMSVAAGTLTKMRKDAAAMPGEFADLLGIFRTTAVPGFHAGMNVEALRSMATQTMAFGAVSGLPMDQVAREMAMLIEGRSGAHNVLGMRLAGLSGGKAESFNKLAAPERIARLNTELGKYAGSIEFYKNSYDGLFTTMVDNGKRFLETATKPLFESVKGSLGSINGWFDSNENYMTTKAQAIGSKLAYAFDQGKSALMEWWPAISTFGENAYAKLVEVWADLGPTLKGAGESLKTFLKDPGSIDKIITVMKLYAGLKVGGAAAGGAMGVAGDLAGIAGGGAQMVGAAKSMGWVKEGTSAAGALSKLGASAGNVALHMVAIAAALGALAMAYDQGTKLFSEMDHDAPLNAMAAFDFGSRSAKNLGRELTAAEYASENFQGTLQNYISNGDAASASAAMAGEAMSGVAAAGWAAAAALGAVGGSGGGAESYTVADAMQMGNDAASSALSMIGMVLNSNNQYRDALVADSKKNGAPKHGGGGGGTTVQKVEIVVTSNQDPSRIARAVLGEIQNFQRHPKMSRGVPNYSATRP